MSRIKFVYPQNNICWCNKEHPVLVKGLQDAKVIRDQNIFEDEDDGMIFNVCDPDKDLREKLYPDEIAVILRSSIYYELENPECFSFPFDEIPTFTIQISNN